jgi:periplasmic protein TonB
MTIQRLSAIFIFVMALTLTPASAQEPIRRLTPDEAVKAAVSKPQPDYPAVARQLRIQGRVEVEVSIDPSGTVDSAKVLSGNPALTGTILPTLKRWRFEPVILNGKPVHAIAILNFNFKL